MLARFIAGRRLGDAAGPGWNGAGSVAGTLGAHGREGGFQLFGLLWGDGGECCRRSGPEQRQRILVILKYET
jgi:hypothetical protein